MWFKLLIILFIILITNNNILAQNLTELKVKSLEIAVTLGAPAFFNAVLGYSFNPVGLRLSGMYLDKDLNGLQMSILYMLKNTTKKAKGFGILFGQSQDKGCDWSYIGPVYSSSSGWLFFEIGLVKVMEVRRGDFSDLPYFILPQIGLMHRFTL